jgi:hypothetical protein
MGSRGDGKQGGKRKGGPGGPPLFFILYLNHSIVERLNPPLEAIVFSLWMQRVREKVEVRGLDRMRRRHRRGVESGNQ